MLPTTIFANFHHRVLASVLGASLIFSSGQALSQQTLIVDGSNKRGWAFKARPGINQSGEAPIQGIAGSCRR